MSEDAELRRFGLARCSRCRRIVLARHLKQGRCRDTTDCVLGRQLAWYQGRERQMVREQPEGAEEEDDGEG